MTTAGEALIKLLCGHALATVCWINHFNVLGRPAFDYHKVIEFPVDNGRECNEAKIVLF